NDSQYARNTPLVPDHGKLMHLFLVREPGEDAFAHLHPIKQDRKTFKTNLPDLPEGSYGVYADITYETGYSDTLTTSVTLPPKADSLSGVPVTLSDPDDSWRIGLERNPALQECHLNAEYSMSWAVPKTIAANSPLMLRFTVRDARGQ